MLVLLPVCRRAICGLVQDGAVLTKAKIGENMSSSSSYHAVPDTPAAVQTATGDASVAADSEDELVE